jgi:hypothetical protein
MTASGFDLGLSDPTRSGVFFVSADDIATLGAACRDAGLRVQRIDLAGCTGKSMLLLRMATALDFPAGTGRNWDALTDRLRDLSWRPAAGHALLFDAAASFRDADESSFEILLDILDETASDWRARDIAFWAFLALPENDFEQDV